MNVIKFFAMCLLLNSLALASLSVTQTLHELASKDPGFTVAQKIAQSVRVLKPPLPSFPSSQPTSSPSAPSSQPTSVPSSQPSSVTFTTSNGDDSMMKASQQGSESNANGDETSTTSTVGIVLLVLIPAMALGVFFFFYSRYNKINYTATGLESRQSSIHGGNNNQEEFSINDEEMMINAKSPEKMGFFSNWLTSKRNVQEDDTEASKFKI
jgi:hypothetical protein